ncbi:secretory protein Sec24B [Pelomyxa schiedti]|nr:secretory protein Sec24B [Pelomyxa schiedti]
MLFSLERFPANRSLKDQCSLPWGGVIRPLHPLSDVMDLPPTQQTSLSNQNASSASTTSSRRTDTPHAQLLALCTSCGAAINPFVEFESSQWICSLCQHHNTITGNSRYASVMTRARLTELTSPFFDYSADLEVSPEQSTIPGSVPLGDSRMDIPTYIALVDLTGGESYIDLVISGLLALLEGLPKYGRFGIVTASQNSVGIFDITSPYPHYKAVAAREEGSTTVTSLMLHEVIPFSRMTASIASYSDQMSNSIESLRSLISSTPTCAPAFGPALKSLISTISLHGPCSVRVLTFLSGPPSFGVGVLRPVQLSNGSGLAPTCSFYQEQAREAAKFCACIDLIIVSDGFVGLPTLRFLAELTGGIIRVYSPASPEGSLPHDLYQWCSHQHSFRGEMKILTSSSLKVLNTTGSISRGSSDTTCSITGGDPYQCITVTFDYISSFISEEKPVVQVLYTYWSTGFSDEDPAGRLRKRLRVYTRRVDMCTSSRDLYQSCNPDVVVNLLSHKIMRVSLEQGLSEARLLIQDFLVLLFANYVESITTTQGAQRALDLSFPLSPSLRTLPPLVFGLLKSPLMGTDAITPDTWIYYHSLCSSLPSELLHILLYPTLSVFDAQGALISSSVSLSCSSLDINEPQVFVLDALTKAFVISVGDVCCMGTNGTALADAVASLVHNRPCVTSVITFQRPTSDSSTFLPILEYLIEDENSRGMSYQQFTSFIGTEVIKVTHH